MLPWLVLVGALELTWFPSGAISSFREQPPDVYLCDLGVVLDAGVHIGGPRVYGFIGGSLGVPVSLYKGPAGVLGVYGMPSSVESTIRVGLVLGPIEAGFEHDCRHPVVVLNVGPISRYREGGNERVYVRISSEGRGRAR